MATRHSFDALIDALKVAAAALREANIPFLLGGSIAAWARGGPLPHHDLDLMVKPRDAQAALRTLADAGMKTEKPPEEWLYKAWQGEVLIDVIFEPSGLELSDEVFERADELAVMSVGMPVMALEDVLLTKLSSLDEHTLDYSPLVGIARSLREQIDWQQLRARTSGSPYAMAFFTLVEELGIAPRQAGQQAAPGSRVRVVADSG